TQLLLQEVGDFAHALEEARREHEIEGCDTDRHAERIATVSAPMRADSHAFGGFRCRKARAQRITAADSLRNRHDVGRDAEPVIGEELSGAADAALDLVEDQEQAALVAEPA